MFLLIWNDFSGECCGPWAICFYKSYPYEIQLTLFQTKKSSLYSSWLVSSIVWLFFLLENNTKLSIRYASAVDNSVTLQIYGDKQKKIQDTDTEITIFIQSQRVKAEINDNILNDLDRAEVSISLYHYVIIVS